MNLLADHLWQSTLFALVAGLLTLALQKNRARVRHWVWFAASLKFLIPVSVLIALGSHIEWRKAAVPSDISLVMVEVSQPFTAQPVAIATAPLVRNPLPEILLGIWICGFIGICCSWVVRWRRVRDAVLAGSVVRLDVPVKVISSPTLLEPGVFGVFRPVLMLPEGIFDRLTPAQLKAVIEHELCHVRHRDNLVAAIHMFVESLFWFHPWVWWTGKRMVEERELGCDEEVVSRGGEAWVYAEAILNVCKLYVESPLECVAGVTGSDLKRRIEAIVSKRIAVRLNFARKVALAVAGASALAVPVVVGIINAPAIEAQSSVAAAPTAKFEVASIRSGCAVREGGGAVSDPGRMILCTTLRTFIRDAYILNKDGRHHSGYVNAGGVPIEGGPGWVYSDRFTVNAKAEGVASFEMIHGPMLQALLEDRFKLKIHRESRVGPAYSLTVARGGAKLQKWQEGSCVFLDISSPPPAQGQVPCGPEPPRAAASGPNFTTVARGLTLDDFSMFLFAMLDRPVLNQTGITGRFDWKLEYAPDQNTPMILSWLAERRRPGVDPNAEPAAAADPNGIPILVAIEQQLGLKLEPARASREFLLIDHAEKPSEN